MVAHAQQARSELTDAVVGVLVLGYLGYMWYASRFLLGVGPATLIVSLYVPFRMEAYDYIPPILVAWMVAILAYVSSGTQYSFVSAGLGAGTFGAWWTYRYGQQRR